MTVSNASSSLAVATQAIQKSQQSLAFVKQNAAAEKAVANAVVEATNRSKDLAAAQGRGQVLDIEV